MDGLSGKSVRRLEDARFLTGAGRYLDDIVPAGAAHLAMVRSPHAHAVITGINATAARAAPGVLGVFTHADLAADGIGAKKKLINRNSVQRFIEYCGMTSIILISAIKKKACAIFYGFNNRFG